LAHCDDAARRSASGDSGSVEAGVAIRYAVPLINGFISVAQMELNALVGEGVIYDLRSALYSFSSWHAPWEIDCAASSASKWKPMPE
jgi:hypothetical protein